MPKGILQFDLPEEREEFELANKAGHLDYVIGRLDEFLRSKIKYAELTEEQANIYQEVRDKLREFQNE